ncbi:ras GTPase-activating protein raskol [Anopheles bellator]|uniref:ras GTPase-activating protein raskol n=1 Tax=Anopheles bellator TaxID=139047 RepID=UPI0026496C60|nr:ras GTPase-activating protein raskol [Anopheles bellator]
MPNLSGDAPSRDMFTLSREPTKSPLNFIRRTNSIKLSRSNSLLKNLTSKCVDNSGDSLYRLGIEVKELDSERLYQLLKQGSVTEDIWRIFFVRYQEDKEAETATLSDTSYDKRYRRGSAPTTPVLYKRMESKSRFTNFFTKRSFRLNHLKRTKSVTKLEQSKHGYAGLRGSRSHESLLSSHAEGLTDLSCGSIGVAPVHSSVLGRRHCFQVCSESLGARYYSCGSRQERDLWIYSLRKSIAPNAFNTYRLDNSLHMWIYEAKALPPKKRYFCEINLDRSLYGRTSAKLRTDLLFWGEFFDFLDVPELTTITVNVYREGEKNKKRDKHILVGSVDIPIQEITTRMFCEDWYAIVPEKQNSVNKSLSKEPLPTIRIKCRFQSITILPTDVYQEFLAFLKANYKTICEIIEPVIGVKAKEDIGQALVLLMHAQGMAAQFLTDVVTLDLLRVADQRLTFRGNSLATKSMEAFLKLTGEQYLQDTLLAPIAEIIASDRDCEVDPTKTNGSLLRQQQALRNAVKTVWEAIINSTHIFPIQLRDCFSTFRERLQDLDRQDMADNLISGSIFLRFLCPAILSPSLFNITNELPSARVARNLTLVAKTLQTLANFTRFQGKENFMEFLNDFLEQEAPCMKQFLYDISNHATKQDDVRGLDFSAYIDQGKQLSILHSLLSDTMAKLHIDHRHELFPLTAILQSITLAKESEVHNVHLRELQRNKHTDPYQPTEQDARRHVLRHNNRGDIPFLDRTANDSLKHSHSASSISLASKSTLHSRVSDRNVHTGESLVKPYQNHYQSPVVSTRGYGSIDSQYFPAPGVSYYQPSNVLTMSSMKDEKIKNPTVSSGIRATTLPRNPSTTKQEAVFTYRSNTSRDNENDKNVDILSTCSSSRNLMRIGLDSNSPFNRKSPTPLLKSTSSSLLHPLEFKHCNVECPIGNDPDKSDNVCICRNAIDTIVSSGTRQPTTEKSNPSNMPMSLADLEDLLNYADEQPVRTMNQVIKNNNVDNRTLHKTEEQLYDKRSDTSLDTMYSNKVTSIYPSNKIHIKNYSPTELAQEEQIQYFTNKPATTVDRAKRFNQNIEKNGMEYVEHFEYLPMSSGSNVNENGSNYGYVPLNSRKQYRSHRSHRQHTIIGDSDDDVPSESSGDEKLNQIMTNHRHELASLTSVKTLSSATVTIARAEIHETDYKLARASDFRRSRMPRTNPTIQYKLGDCLDIHHSLQDKHVLSHYERRQSEESDRTISESQADIVSGPSSSSSSQHQTNYVKENMSLCKNSKSVEQCQMEIQRLQASLDSMRHKLEMSEVKDEPNTDVANVSHHLDNSIRSIIGRLLSMEEELREEQQQMSLALSLKQKVIEAQGQQIAALDAANNRLLIALSSLQNRYVKQSSIEE